MTQQFVRFAVSGLLTASVLIGTGCQSAPYTGRRQLLLISQDQENAMGLQAYQEVVATSKLTADRTLGGRVEAVGRRIAVVADRPDFEWEFKVIAEPTVNAFCLPGGKVAFYEGILPICASDEGIAVVMGHEVAHALLRHGGERVSQSIVAQGGTEIMAAILGGRDASLREKVASALGVGVNVGVLLPWGRDQESEADHVGLILMAKAGYDPREAPRFWQRMEAATGGEGRPPEFLSTHPNPETRISQLNAWMDEALRHYEEARAARR